MPSRFTLSREEFQADLSTTRVAAEVPPPSARFASSACPPAHHHRLAHQLSVNRSLPTRSKAHRAARAPRARSPRAVAARGGAGRAPDARLAAEVERCSVASPRFPYPTTRPALRYRTRTPSRCASLGCSAYGRLGVDDERKKDLAKRFFALCTCSCRAVRAAGNCLHPPHRRRREGTNSASSTIAIPAATWCCRACADDRDHPERFRSTREQLRAQASDGDASAPIRESPASSNPRCCAGTQYAYNEVCEGLARLDAVGGLSSHSSDTFAMREVHESAPSGRCSAAVRQAATSVAARSADVHASFHVARVDLDLCPLRRSDRRNPVGEFGSTAIQTISRSSHARCSTPTRPPPADRLSALEFGKRTRTEHMTGAAREAGLRIVSNSNPCSAYRGSEPDAAAARSSRTRANGHNSFFKATTCSAHGRSRRERRLHGVRAPLRDDSRAPRLRGGREILDASCLMDHGVSRYPHPRPLTPQPSASACATRDHA